MALELQTDIRYLKGVGESRAALYRAQAEKIRMEMEAEK